LFGVPRPRRHLDPLEPHERAALRRLRLLLQLEPSFLFQPARIVALPRIRAAVELEIHPATLSTVAIVRDRDDSAWVPARRSSQATDSASRVRGSSRSAPGHFEKDPQSATRRFAAGDLRHVGVGRRKPERVHRDLELVIELPRVGRLDRVLHALVLGRDFASAPKALPSFSLSSSNRFRSARVGARQLDVAEHVFRGVEPRVLGQEPRACLRRETPAREVLLDARYDLQWTCPRRSPSTPIFAPGRNEVDALQDLALRRDDLPQVDHRVDVLVCHRAGESTGF
jgi:hypothetical protein